MADNPYLFGGFGEGFSRGLEIAWKQHDRKIAEEERQRGHEAQAEEMGMKRQLFSQQLTAGEQDVKLKGLQVKEAEAKAPFYAESARAGAAKDRASAYESTQKAELFKEQVTASKGLRKASESQAKIEEMNRLFGEHLADQIEDPKWLERGRLVDDVINGAQVDESLLNQHKGDILAWVDQTVKPIWDQGVGKPLDKGVASKLGLGTGAKVVSLKPVDVHINKERGTAVFELQVTATDSSGKTVVYNAPMTENRTSDPKDFVKEIPLWKLEKAAQAGGMFAHIADEAGLQGKTPSDVRAWIKGQLANPVKGKGGVSKVPAKIQEIQKYGDTKFKDEPDADKRYAMAAEELNKKVNYQSVTNRMNSYLANDPTGDMTPEQARQMAERDAYKEASEEEEQVIDIYMPGAGP